MKKFLLFFVSVVSALIMIIPPTKASAETVSVSVSSVVANQYLASNRSVAYDKPVLQSNLSIGLTHGFSAGIWNSKTFEEWNADYGSEIDYSAGWAGKLFKSGIDLSLGTSYYDLYPVGEFGPDDLVNVSAKVSKDLPMFTVSLGLQKFIATGDAITGGDLYAVGLSKTASPDDLKDLSMVTSLEIVYDDGFLGLNHGFFIRGNHELDWSLSKKFVLTLPVVYYNVPIDVDDERCSNIMLSGGIRYSP